MKKFMQAFMAFLPALLITTLSFSEASAQALSIFDNKQSIELFLKATKGSFKELFSKRAIPNQPVPPEIDDFKIIGEILYTSHTGSPVSVPVEIQLRGNTSQSEDQCPFPKLKIKFDPNTSKGTLFENDREVGVATHCNMAEGTSPKYGRVWGGKNPQREVLVYEMMEALKIPTFKTRFALISYFENTGEVMVSQAPAFFLEDMSGFLKRVNGREILGTDVKSEKRKSGPKAPPYIFNSVSEAPGVSPLDVAKIFFFQNLVRNNDFHLRLFPTDESRALWNMKAVELSPEKWMVFPYDFDLAGIIKGNDKNRKTANLRERFALNVRLQAAAEFEARKNELYQIARKLKSSDPEGFRSFQDRLDLFFVELSDLKQ